MQNSILYYADKTQKLQNDIQKLTRQILQIGFARLFSFIASLVSLYIWELTATAWIFFAIFIIIFLALIKVYGSKEEKRNEYRLLNDFLVKHMDALKKWDFTSFPDGSNFKNANHPYSADVTIFGPHSLHQQLNRCHPNFGEKKLAQLEMELHISQETILERQQAIQELSSNPEFMNRLYVLLRKNEIDQTKLDTLTEWMERSISDKTRRKWKWSGITQIVAFALTLGAIVFFHFPVSILVIPMAIASFLLSPSFKKTNVLLAKTDKLSLFLLQLQQLSAAIEKEKFSAVLLQRNQEKLLQPKSASTSMQRLMKAFIKLEYRQNILVGFILNLVCLWDIWALLSIENIKSEISEHLDIWMDTYRFFDANCSLSRFAFDQPQAIYPTFSTSNDKWFSAVEMGHPFIPENRRINNDFEIQKGTISLITGANMAGKSTFLRTLGIHMIMAQMGLPVFARSLKLHPGFMYTSMLAADDLSEERSYFLAEVERLAKLDVFRTENPETLLILDEILKGTNSHDKELGSRLFIEKLVRQGATAIIATHDLALTKMAESYPQILNYCFEVEHTKDAMLFDYKLRTGATQNMNALRLMQQKGLIDSIDPERP